LPKRDVARLPRTDRPNKIVTFEHPPSTHGLKIATKQALGTLYIVENAQLSTGAPPGT
jgi:hypothetical protein